jgi:hypothetical protein
VEKPFAKIIFHFNELEISHNIAMKKFAIPGRNGPYIGFHGWRGTV